MTIPERFVSFAPWTERINKSLLEWLVEAMSVIADEVSVDRKSSIRLKVHEFAEFLGVGGPTRGGEGHDGSLLKQLEPQMLRHGRIEHAERVEEPALPHALETIAGAGISGLRGLVPIAVHHEHSCLLERRHEKDRRVGVVMAHLDNLRQLAQTEMAHQSPPQPVWQGNDQGRLGRAGARGK